MALAFWADQRSTQADFSHWASCTKHRRAPNTMHWTPRTHQAPRNGHRIRFSPGCWHEGFAAPYFATNTPLHFSKVVQGLFHGFMLFREFFLCCLIVQCSLVLDKSKLLFGTDQRRNLCSNIVVPYVASARDTVPPTLSFTPSEGLGLVKGFRFWDTSGGRRDDRCILGKVHGAICAVIFDRVLCPIARCRLGQQPRCVRTCFDMNDQHPQSLFQQLRGTVQHQNTPPSTSPFFLFTPSIDTKLLVNTKT